MAGDITVGSLKVVLGAQIDSSTESLIRKYMSTLNRTKQPIDECTKKLQAFIDRIGVQGSVVATAASGNTKLANSFTKVSSEAQRASSRISTSSRQMISAGRSANTLLANLNNISGAFQTLQTFVFSPAKGFLDTAGEFERMQKLLEGVSDATDEAGKKLDAASSKNFIIDMAKNAPFEIGALQDAFVKLKVGGIDPTNGSLQSLVDSIASFGGDSEVLKRAAIALQQMGGKGVVSMEELRQQLGEGVPSAISAMAFSMGVSMGDLVKQISKGTVESKQAVSLMLDQLGKENAGAAERMMDTWVGMTSRLKTEWKLFQDEIANSGVMDVAKQSVSSLIDAFKGEELKTALKDVASSLATLVSGLAEATKFLVEHANVVMKVIEGYALLKAIDWMKGLGGSQQEQGTISKFWDSYKQKVDGVRQSQIAMAAEQKEAQVEGSMGYMESLNKQLAAEQNLATQKRALYQQTLEEYEAGATRYEEIQTQNATRLQELAALEQECAEKARIAREEAQSELNTNGYSARVAALQNVAAAYERNIQVIQQEREQIIATAEAYQRWLVSVEETLSSMEMEEEERQLLIEKIQEQRAALEELIATQSGELASLQSGTGAAAEHAGQVDGVTKASQFCNAATEALDEKVQSFTDSLKNSISAMISGVAQMTIMTGVAYGLSYAVQAIADAFRRATNEMMYFENLRRKVEAGKAADDEISKLSARKSELERAKRNGGTYYDDPITGTSTFMGLSSDELAKINSELKDTTRALETNYAIRREIEAQTHISGLMQGVTAKNKDFNARISEAAKSGRHRSDADPANAKKYKQESDKRVAEIAAERDAYNKEQKAYLQRQLDAAVASGNGAEIAAASGALNNYNKYANGSGVAGASGKVGEIPNISGKGGSGKSGSGRNGKKSSGSRGGNKKDQVSDFLTSLQADNDKLAIENQTLSGNVDDTKSLFEQAAAIVEGKIGKNLKGNKNADTIRANAIALEKEHLQLAAANKLLKSSTDAVAKSEEQVAINRLELSGGLDNVSSSVESLLKKWASEDRQLKIVREEDKKVIEQKRALALVNTIEADSLEELKTARESLKDTKISDIADTGIRRQVERDNELDKITKQHNTRTGFLDKAFKEGQIDFKTYLDKGQTEFAAFEAQIEAKTAELEISQRTALQNLSHEWQDVTGNMEDASKSWANSFKTNYQAMLEGGEYDWRSFLTGMLSDINEILIQRMMSYTINPMLDAMQSGLSSAFNSLYGIKAPDLSVESATEDANIIALDANTTALWAVQAALGGSALAGGTGAAVSTTGASGIAGTLGGVTDYAGMGVTVDKFGGLNKQVDTVTDSLGIAGSALGTTTDAVSAAGTVTNVASAITQAGGTTLETSTSILQASFTELTASTQALIAAQQQQVAQAQTQSTSGSGGGLFGWLGGLFGGSSSANGNIVGSHGPMKLHKYANGGIATSPHLALFGEGSTPEAFVPLPDGRSIPVTLQGNQSAGGSYTPVSIQINVENNGESSSTSGSNDDQNKVWNNLAQRIKGMVVEEIATQKRPGGVLYAK